MDLVDRGKFNHLDYILFVIVIVLSAGIGLYYAIKTRKAVTTVDDYLLGGRKMGLLPVSCSLVATSLSATASVGIAAEGYAYGTYMWIFVVNAVVMGIVVSWIFLPIFSELQLTSVFKYFELRFNRRVRLLASGFYLFCGVIYLAYIVYVPAVTFQRVSGVDTRIMIIVLSVTTAIYTSIGGFKAVIWTDVVQLVFMFGSMIIIIIVGLNSVNGIENVFNAANRGGRIVIANTNVINSRTSLWGLIFSSVFLNIYQYGLNQTNIQRFLSCISVKRMKISVWIQATMWTVFLYLSIIVGMVIYASYESCDPYTAGIIRRVDQILPHFIQDKAYLFHGFNGIFIAGVFSASLSTASSYLNAMSGIIYEDFIKQIFPRIRENTAGRLMKSTVFILAILQIGLVFFIEKMGTIAQIAFQVMAISSCALLSLFFLGVFIPKTNSKGAQAGAVASLAIILIMITGSLNVKSEPFLPFRTDGCMSQYNTTQPISSSSTKPLTNSQDEVFWLFKINFNYYGLIGVLTGLSVGYIVSLLTGGNTVEDQRLIAKFLRKKTLQKEEELLTFPGEK